jgi:hypothetical protein
MPRYHPREEGREFGEPKYTDDELIGFLQNFARKHGRSPKVKEFEELSRQNLAPSPNIYSRRGGWNWFLERAELQLNTKNRNWEQGEVRAMIISYVKDFQVKNPGKWPTMADINRDTKLGLCPPHPAVTKYYKSVSNCLQILCGKPFRRVGK